MSRAIQLLQSRIDTSFSSGNAYEASQLYDTLSSRLITSRHPDPLPLLSPGVSRFLSMQQPSCAFSIALLLPDTLSQIGLHADSAVTQRLVQVHKELEGEQVYNESYLRSCVAYTSKFGDNVLGSAVLNRELGVWLWERKKDYVGASDALMKGEAYREHAGLLVEWAGQGFRSEVDLFIARAVMQYLCVENMKGANAVMKEFMDAFEKLETPLTNFVKLCKKDLKG